MVHYNVKKFTELTTEELYDIIASRESVFVVEQNCPYQETDGVDREATHLWLEEEGAIKAYLRIFMKNESTVQIGRVLTTERGKGYGGDLLHRAVEYIEENIKPAIIFLEAQTYATGFYEKEGFVSFGEVFLEDGIPHIKMQKKL
ncbi:MAG: GNAT family N-acetyltransferase [Clostridia bacterium]|nr:GNAT family N-acetyltransferase [Clostridia bacterium]